MYCMAIVKPGPGRPDTVFRVTYILLRTREMVGTTHGEHGHNKLCVSVYKTVCVTVVVRIERIVCTV